MFCYPGRRSVSTKRSCSWLPQKRTTQLQLSELQARCSKTRNRMPTVPAHKVPGCLHARAIARAGTESEESTSNPHARRRDEASKLLLRLLMECNHLLHVETLLLCFAATGLHRAELHSRFASMTVFVLWLSVDERATVRQQRVSPSEISSLQSWPAALVRGQRDSLLEALTRRSHLRRILAPTRHHPTLTQQKRATGSHVSVRQPPWTVP